MTISDITGIVLSLIVVAFIVSWVMDSPQGKATIIINPTPTGTVMP